MAWHHTAKGELRSTFVDEICPFCFETFRLKETPFRCISPPSSCAPVPDPALQRIWRDTRPVGRVIPPAHRFAQRGNCPTCGTASQKRLCPHCHQELPHTFGQYRNYIFAVIGAKGAGKSHYITSLLEHLKQHVGPRLNILIQPINDYTISRYNDDFRKPLYDEHRTLDVTQSAVSNTKNRIPLVFSAAFTGRSLLGRDVIKKALTLAFFDTAGEDLKAEDTMSTVNRYIYRSDGIILLLDPLQLNYVRDRLPGPMPPADTETSDIVSRTTKLIRLGLGLRQDRKIAIPLAVVLSKMDAVAPLLDPHSQFGASARPRAGFDVKDCEAMNGEIQSLIAEWSSEHLLHQVRTEFSAHHFFGISALGSPPSTAGTVVNVVPRRVEDPFLWLLHRHGLVKAAE
ncbi:GTPase domain-containing protein [Azospirillum formosense]|uniref:GTPase domain-containing protein n=1 Tax=Azospirillum formosense TaxID=861533 RepID=UPI001C92765A|nr:GTPase domain-containing protein [Azospirillum formosense]MBY3757173.1 hypothetical protein [Azospirillum formosense]